MERVIHRGRWSKKDTVGTILLMCMFLPTLTSLQPAEEPTCEPGDYLNEDGICCPRCFRGYKLVEKCKGVGQRSNCTQCPKGQYTDHPNYSLNCQGCTTCLKHKHEVEKEACQPHKDTVCQCEKGYYKFYIDSTTSGCRLCTRCKANEQETKSCDPDSNAVCECKENYYRVKRQCQPCENCTSGCDQYCKPPPSHTKGPPPEDNNNSLINIIGGLAATAVVVLVLVIVITFMVTKWFTKKKLQSSTSESADTSTDLFTILIKDQEPSNDVGLNAAPSSPACEHEQLSSLPDCVPFEVKWPDLVYMVLDVVPVLRVKELVRSLGVRDMEIEQIEVDCQSCREAHYQMLRVWAEKGSRAGGVLHQRLLQELVNKLREMHLGLAAEELETKYGIQ